MAVSAPFVIEKLNADNYATWCADIQILLMDKEVWEIVIGEEKIPCVKDKRTITSIDKVTGKETVTVVGDEVVEREIKDFKSRSGHARALLYINIEPEFRKLIEGILDVTEIWKILKENFLPDSRARHMELMSNFFGCKIEVGESVVMFGSRIKRIAEQLRSIGEPIEEKFMCFQVTRYLPRQFDSIVQGILRWPNDRFKFREIVVELGAEETRIRVRDGDRTEYTDLEAYHVRTSRRQGSGKTIICFKCRKPGHIAPKCPENEGGFRQPGKFNTGGVDTGRSRQRSISPYKRSNFGHSAQKKRGARSGKRRSSMHVSPN